MKLAVVLCMSMIGQADNYSIVTAAVQECDTDYGNATQTRWNNLGFLNQVTTMQEQVAQLLVDNNVTSGTLMDLYFYAMDAISQANSFDLDFMDDGVVAKANERNALYYRDIEDWDNAYRSLGIAQDSLVDMMQNANNIGSSANGAYQLLLEIQNSL